MARYRDHLPQIEGGPFLTDGGLETTLVFHEGVDLPHFAAFVLLRDDAGQKKLAEYYRRYAAIAEARGTGLILESATWRANPDWAAELGMPLADLDVLNWAAISILHQLRAELEPRVSPIVLSGQIGPRGDGYAVEAAMTPSAACAYHARQIGVFAQTEADMVAALTMTHVGEAAGVALAARDAGLPSAISFTVETDGRLPSGQPLGEAIEEVDAETDAAPAYYMINCAHPRHFQDALDGPWIARIRGLRANASTKSHAELDAATEIDIGDMDDLASCHSALGDRLPKLNVLGGCCGTDHRHVEKIAEACLA